MNKKHPPSWAVRLFHYFCNDHLSEAVLGDLIELYDRRVTAMRKAAADFLFIWGVIQFIQPFALRKKKTSSPNQLSMFRNYFKITFRSMSRQKMYTGIKIGGFAIGLATCMIIAVFIRHELSYDKHYVNGSRTFRLYNHYTSTNPSKWTATPAPLIGILRDEFPEIEKAGRLIPYKWFNAGSNLVRTENQTENTYQEGFAYADQDLLDVLEIPMIYGNREHALDKPNTIVFSRTMAEKYFPGENPVGKSIFFNDDTKRPYMIGGVMEDFSPTSHLNQYQFLITLTGEEFWEGEQGSWCCWNYNPYLRLHEGVDPVAFEEKLQSVTKNHYGAYLAKEGSVSLNDVLKYHKFRLQTVGDIYLGSDDIGDQIPHGDMRYIIMFGGIAIFILLLACVNFINLSTAKSANRAKEVGLRKVVGSARGNLVRQFLTESVMYSLISFIIAVGLVILALPYFSLFAGKDLTIPWAEWWLFPTLTGGALLIGVIAGLYPSFYLSAFKPIDVLKGSVARGSRNSTLRSSMVIFQFTTSIILIIGTFVVYRQMDFILHSKIGFEKDQVVMVQGAGSLGRERRATLKEELLRNSAVMSVTSTNYLPVGGTNRDQNGFYKEGKSKEETSVGAQAWWIDDEYLKTLGIKLLEGRNFNRDLKSDTASIIVNQALIKEMGLKEPVLGQRIENWRPWTIIGVVEDFHFETMKDKIGPLTFMYGTGGQVVAVKVKTNDMQQTISDIKSTWDKIMPTTPFRYTFMDESYAMMYQDVERTGNLFAGFALLAILVACLGLFALSSFMAEQRKKEVSIRLVLGASVGNIFRLLTRSFVFLVLMSFVIASPLGWYMMMRWLEGYNYKTDITWDIFAVAGFSAVLIALLTVSYQSVKVALGNPANNLRSE